MILRVCLGAASHGAVFLLACVCVAQEAPESPTITQEAPESVPVAPPNDTVPRAPQPVVPGAPAPGNAEQSGPPPGPFYPQYPNYPSYPDQPSASGHWRLYTAPNESQPTSRWYGWQTLTADGVAVTLLLLGAGIESGRNSNDLGEVMMFGAVGGYFVAPPIIHFAHGQIWKGFVSLGMRAVLPFGGAAVGVAMEECHDGESFCGLAGGAFGLLVGYAAAVSIDAAALAWKPANARPKEEFPKQYSLTLAPSLVTGDRSIGLGLAGWY